MEKSRTQVLNLPHYKIIPKIKPEREVLLRCVNWKGNSRATAKIESIQEKKYRIRNNKWGACVLNNENLTQDQMLKKSESEDYQLITGVEGFSLKSTNWI